MITRPIMYMVPLKLYLDPAQNNLGGKTGKQRLCQCHSLEAFGTGGKDTESLDKGSASKFILGSSRAHFPEADPPVWLSLPLLRIKTCEEKLPPGNEHVTRGGGAMTFRV